MSTSKPESRAAEAHRLDAIVNQAIADIESNLALASKTGFDDPVLDAPMDAKAFFSFVSIEPQAIGNEICDTFFKTVVGLRFSKGGSITHRELNYLRKKCDNWREAYARKNVEAT